MDSLHPSLMSDDRQKRLGQAIRAFRKETGKSQDKLAEEAGLDRTYISMLELGQASPTVMTLENVAKAMNTSASAILKRYEEGDA